jgi:hypothetical protein
VDRSKHQRRKPTPWASDLAALLAAAVLLVMITPFPPGIAASDGMKSLAILAATECGTGCLLPAVDGRSQETGQQVMVRSMGLALLFKAVPQYSHPTFPAAGTISRFAGKDYFDYRDRTKSGFYTGCIVKGHPLTDLLKLIGQQPASGLPVNFRRLRGETVIVTGAGGGIGSEAARALLWLGANVVIAEINTAAGEQAAVKLGQEFEAGRVLFVHTDVGDETSVQRLHQASVERFGRVDAVINNATIAVLGEVKDLPIETWDASYRANLRDRC